MPSGSQMAALNVFTVKACLDLQFSASPSGIQTAL